MRQDEPGDRVQRRRLAGAVRPDQTDDLALRDPEAHAAHGRHGPVANLDRDQLEHQLSHRRPRPARSRQVRTCDVEVGADLVGRPLREGATLVEDVDPVAHVHDERHVVVDQKHSGLVLVPHRSNDGRELGHLGFGQAGGGLVQQHEARPGRQGAGDAESPLVTVREGVRGKLCLRAQRHQLEQLIRSRSRSPSAEARAERGHLDVLAHRQLPEGAAVLEGARQPAAGAAARAPASDLPALELDRALARNVEPAEHVDERRLTGAVRADQPHHLVPVQLERHVLQRARTPSNDRETEEARRSSGPLP